MTGSRRWGAILCAAVVVGAISLAWQWQRPDDRPGYVLRKDRPGEAADYFLAQRVGPGQELPVERYQAALAAQATMARLGGTGAKLGASAWEPVGPGGVGGRTRALLIDPLQPERMFAAGVSGGVWRSTDGGASWSGAGQHAFTNLAVASLAMHPDDSRTLFAGTGEGVYVGRPVTRSRGVRGDGIFLSRDGGLTWRHLASTRGNGNFDYVNRLVFDGDGRLHAATRAGLFVSADQGESWTQGLAPPNAEGCAELVHVPGLQRLVATCGVFSQAALYVSDDGGASWAATALPAGAGRTTLAVAPSDSSVLFALSAHNGDYGFLALRRSADGGLSWQTVLTRATADPLSRVLLSNPLGATDGNCNLIPGALFGQGWFDNVIAVDPVDPDVLYVGGVDLFRSDDGGASFRLMSRWWVDAALPSYAHADQHAIVFDPRYDGVENTRMFVANDGGVHLTEDARGTVSTDICAEGGTLAWEARNEGYLVTQFYDGVVSADGTRLIGGTQDNGTHMGHSLAQPWREVFGGDGGYAALDPRDPDRYYVSTPYAGFVRTDDDMASFVPLLDGLPPQISEYLFIHPLLLDPNAPDVLWTGAGAQIYRSEDRGDTWQPTSEDPVHAGGGILSALSVAPGNSAHVVVGLDNGTLARSIDGGASWVAAQPRAGFVSSLTIDAADTQRVYATYATFGGAHLFASADGGASWQPLDGSAGYALPDVPAHTLAIDPGNPQRLWLGTDIGLFVSPDRGQRWYADGSGLGSVLIEALRVSAGTTPSLVAFTYGRGAWRAPLSALASRPFNPGLAGAWYDTDTPGQGFFFETVPAAAVITASWYTWGEDGGGANHLWLTGSGQLADGRATVTLFLVPHGHFAADGAAPVEQAGTLVVDFADCRHASAQYTLQHPALGARSGTIALSRLTTDRWCEAFRAHGDAALGELAQDAAAGDIEYGHGGSWASADAQSQGFTFDFDPATGLAVGSWYTFDPLLARSAGQAPTWYSAQGALDGPLATMTLLRSTGGAFAGADPVATDPVGTLTLRARSCGAIDADYTLTLGDGSQRSGSFSLARITAATVCEAMAP